MTNITENAIQDLRAEFVLSDTSGDVARPPSNPSWDRFGDYFVSYPDWNMSVMPEPFTPVGHGDRSHTFRGAEEHDLTAVWLMQEHFVDGSDNANNPIGRMLDHDYASEYPVYELVFRRDVAYGGVKSGGFREYIYASGAQPTTARIPGDPSTGQPIALENEFWAEKVRDYVIHQPASSITPQVKSTDSGDTTQTVTLENADASTTDTFSLNGTTKVGGSSGSSFSGIDAVWVDAEHVGDIQVFDGNSNNLLEEDIAGTDTNGVEADRGIPLLGTGSHSSAIGTDPESYQFLGTSVTWGGSELATSTTEDRVTTLDLTVDVELSREPRQGWRRQVIDPGPRTATVEPQTSGPQEAAKQVYDLFAGTQQDVVYTFPDGTVTVVSAQPEDVDPVNREGGDANELRNMTLVGNADPAVKTSHS